MVGEETQAPQMEGHKMDSGTERLERLHDFEVSCAAKVRYRQEMTDLHYVWMLRGLVSGSSLQAALPLNRGEPYRGLVLLEVLDPQWTS